MSAFLKTAVNAAPVAPPLVRVRNLVRRFTAKGVLNGIDLDIAEGEFVALIGRSGSGKSTLLRALADLDREAVGSGEFEVSPRLSVAFQDARLLPWKRVLDNVILGLDGPDAATRGRLALAEVELGSREQSWPYELSGGEQQRVALARSLVREPQLLLADEPFGALDALTRTRMHSLLREIRTRHRLTTLLVTHDVDEAIALAGRVIVLRDGRIAAQRQIALPSAPDARRRAAVALHEDLLDLVGSEDASMATGAVSLVEIKGRP